MALFDRVDLIARCKRGAARPGSDEDKGPTDADVDALWEALLTEAQLHWVRQLALHVPEQMYVFETLTTADAGVTYTFTKEPLGNYELRATRAGRLLVPGPDWDMAVDFVPNGQTIRFPGGKAKTFPNGPVARYVKTPDVIVGGGSPVEPSLLPVHARILIVDRALILWATRGGLADPQPYRDRENEDWFGRPEFGDYGILGALKMQVFLDGSAAIPAGAADDWWRYVDSGEGYVPGTG